MAEKDLEKLDGDIANALIEASEFLRGEDKQRRIPVRRNGKELFSYTVKPISEDTLRKCRRQNTKNRGQRNEEVDGSRFVSALIYAATIDEDRERLWKNKEVWSKLGAVSGVDVINAVLTPADKSRAEDILMQISGFTDDDEDISEEIKN